MMDLCTRLDQFGQHLRAPRQQPCPPGLPARAVAVYAELLFNNFRGFCDACFPVCRQVLGAARWTGLLQKFFRAGSSQTPWFREVPLELVNFLGTHRESLRLPRWLPELAHYEWAELAVDTMAVVQPAYRAEGDLLEERLVANPALMNLNYAWPVHRISREWRPRQPQLSCLAVFRDAEEQVRFVQLNPASSRLLALCQAGNCRGRDALSQLALELNLSDPQALWVQGERQLHTLQQQGLLMGVAP